MISLKEFLLNASIIISIIYISSLLHKHLFINLKQREKDISFALIAIFAGWCSMFFGIHVGNSVIFDLRFAPVIIAALHYRNPLYIFIIGVGIGLLRFSLGWNHAATIGFIKMTILSGFGVLIFFLSKEWGPFKKMVTTVILLNLFNMVLTMGIGILPIKEYLALFMPALFPASLLLSLLLLWIVHDLKEEYSHKMYLIIEANKDPLTKVYNRRGLMSNFNQLVFKRSESCPLTVAFMDLDHFKIVNDQYGHIMGDQVLKEVSSLIAENIRNLDVLGRYGGEEFVVLLPNCKKDEACKVLERIRHKIETFPIKVNEETIQVTISIGIASTESFQPKDLFAAADHAVYIAKDQGRNLIWCAE
jgi:diguanylate cyclase